MIVGGCRECLYCWWVDCKLTSALLLTSFPGSSPMCEWNGESGSGNEATLLAIPSMPIPPNYLRWFYESSISIQHILLLTVVGSRVGYHCAICTVIDDPGQIWQTRAHGVGFSLVPRPFPLQFLTTWRFFYYILQTAKKWRLEMLRSYRQALIMLVRWLGFTCLGCVCWFIPPAVPNWCSFESRGCTCAWVDQTLHGMYCQLALGIHPLFQGSEAKWCHKFYYSLSYFAVLSTQMASHRVGNFETLNLLTTEL